MSETGLAHETNSHEASSHADISRPSEVRLFQLFSSLRCVLRKDLIESVGELELAAVGGLSQRLNLLQLLAPQVIDMVVECQGGPFVRCVEGRL